MQFKSKTVMKFDVQRRMLLRVYGRLNYKEIKTKLNSDESQLGARQLNECKNDMHWKLAAMLRM